MQHNPRKQAPPNRSRAPIVPDPSCEPAMVARALQPAWNSEPLLIVATAIRATRNAFLIRSIVMFSLLRWLFVLGGHHRWRPQRRVFADRWEAFHGDSVGWATAFRQLPRKCHRKP